MITSKLSKLVKGLLYLSPFAFPFYFIKFQFQGIPFTVLEAFTYLLFTVWFLRLVADHRSFILDKTFRPYFWAVFLFLAAVTVSALVVPGSIPQVNGDVLDAPRVALGIWKGWIVAPILYFIVITQTLRKESEVGTLLRAYVYSAALVALSGYIMALWGGGYTYDFRLSAFYESANYLALYLVPALLINLYFFFTRTFPLTFQNYVDDATALILIHALFLTQSYAGIIAVFGALMLYAFYFALKNGSFRKAMKVSALLLFTLIVISATQINTPKFRQFIDFQNRSSSSVRLEVYEIATYLIRHHPVNGVGPGLFQVYYQNSAHPALGHVPMEWNIPHPHNIFFGFWLNAGVFGLVAFLILILYAHRRFTYPLLALWGILIHGLFDMPFWKNDLAMIFWVVLGSIVVLQHATISTQIQTAKPPRQPSKGASGRAQKGRKKTAKR